MNYYEARQLRISRTTMTSYAGSQLGIKMNYYELVWGHPANNYYEFIEIKKKSLQIHLN